MASYQESDRTRRRGGLLMLMIMQRGRKLKRNFKKKDGLGLARQAGMHASM